MQSMNKAYLLGTLAADPETRAGVNGAPVVILSLSTPNTRHVDGGWVDVQDARRIYVNGNDGEYLARYAHKGDVLCVECAIRPQVWMDRDSAKHYDVAIEVQRILWMKVTTRPIEAPTQPVDAAEVF